MSLSVEFYNRTLTSAILIGGLLVFLFALPPFFFSLLLAVAAGYIYLFEWPLLKTRCPIHWSLTGLIYPIAPFIVLIYLNQYYRTLVVLIFILTPLFDIVSYLAGKKWGKTPIAPSVSPGKTWQGFLGGMVAVLIALNVYANIYHISVSQRLFLNLFSIVFSVVALIGDLFESWIKRKAQVKDSGSLLPGHGGLLDRVDAMLAVGLLVLLLKPYLLAAL